MKAVLVAMRYAYGNAALGDSLGYRGYLAFQKLSDQVAPFWLDEYLHDHKRLNETLLSFVAEQRPDVVFLSLMNDEISIETLDRLKELAVTVNWFGDDTWRFDAFTVRYAPHVAYAITTEKNMLPKYREAGIDNVILSQWHSYDALESLALDDVAYQYDVTFVGLYSGYRDWVLKQVRNAGFRVECFGHGWPAGIVSFEKMEEIFLTSRINLNISNSVSYDIRCLLTTPRAVRQFVGSLVKRGRKTAEQIKARNFEIPAFGGFQLTNYVPGIEDYFHIGKDIAVYSHVGDLIFQIGYYMEHENLRRDMIWKSYDLVAQNYCYVHQVRAILEQIGLT